MLHEMQVLFNERAGKDLEKKISRRKLIVASFAIVLSAIITKTKSPELPQHNTSTAYGSGAYGG